MDKKFKADLVERESLDRKSKKERSKRGFNFVGSEYKWTDIDEQKMKAQEIDNLEKNKF